MAVVSLSQRNCWFYFPQVQRVARLSERYKSFTQNVTFWSGMLAIGLMFTIPFFRFYFVEFLFYFTIETRKILTFNLYFFLWIDGFLFFVIHFSITFSLQISMQRVCVLIAGKWGVADNVILQPGAVRETKKTYYNIFMTCTVYSGDCALLTLFVGVLCRWRRADYCN